ERGVVAGAAGHEEHRVRVVPADAVGYSVELGARLGQQGAPLRGLLGDLGGHPAAPDEGVHEVSTSRWASRMAPATGSRGMTRTSAIPTAARRLQRRRA